MQRVHSWRVSRERAMQQQQYDETLVRSLLETARDETKGAEERYGALRHVCQLRGDAYQHVPLEQLRFMAAAMQSFPNWRPLSLKDSAEAVASGFARRTAPSRHR